MSERMFLNDLSGIDTSPEVDTHEILDQIVTYANQNEYDVVERNGEKPWGGYIRLSNDNADEFVREFFPEVSPTEARLGNPELSLSPKILLAAPDQRLSWQYHHRRAERWAFVTPGRYSLSVSDIEGEVVDSAPGEVLQISQGERHRLIGAVGSYAIVAEIWQHTDPENPSTEDDIVRVQDDYSR